MDFALTEDQRMLQQTLRDFIKTEFPLKLLRKIEENGLQEFLPVYRKMAELGFLGLTIPEQYGGSGGSWIDLAILNEEAGHGLLPSVHINSIILGCGTILAFGSEDQKRRLVPPTTAGEQIITPAWLEEGADPRSPNLQSKASKMDNGFAVYGHKHFVTHIQAASHLLVLARAEKKEQVDEDIVFLLVRQNSKGLSQRLLRVQSGELVGEIQFQGVLATEDNYFNGEWSKWLRLVDGAKIALGAYSIGAAQMALDMAVQYAKERVQFDRPIGSFQAIQHKLADVAILIEEARTIVYYSAWLIDQGKDCTQEAAMAKLLSAKAFGQAATTSAVVHGALGFSMDHDIQLYFRRAKTLEYQMESTEEQKEIIARLSGM